MKSKNIVLSSLAFTSMLIISSVSYADRTISYSNPDDGCLDPITGMDSLTRGFKNGTRSSQNGIRKFHMNATVEAPCKVDFMAIKFKTWNIYSMVTPPDTWNPIENTTKYKEATATSFLSISKTYEAPKRGGSAGGVRNSPSCMGVGRKVSNNGIQADTSGWHYTFVGTSYKTGGASRNCTGRPLPNGF